MKLGARMLKTGLAVAISLYLATLLNLPTPVFAGIAAVFAIKPSVYRSFQTILEQVQANIIGAVIAVLSVLALGNAPLVIGFTTVLVIGICMSMKMSESTLLLAIVAVIAIMQTAEVEFIYFAVTRFFTLTLGILSAFLVNQFFLPPKYETRLFQRIEDITTDTLQWLRVTTRQLSNEPALKEEIERLEEEINKMDLTYTWFSEERSILKKNQYLKARKLIVFRQLIATTKKSFYVLKAFHNLDEKIETIPREFQVALVEELDKVIHSHEKLILSSMGRVKQELKNSLLSISEPDLLKVVETLIDVYQKGEEKRLTLLPLASQLLEYQQELEHLQTLLNSYQTYHRNEQLQMKHVEHF